MPFGIQPPDKIEVDFAAVMQRMRRIRASISHHDSAERFRQSGIDVFLGDAQFVGEAAIAVNGSHLRFKKAVIATGARATPPRVPGLAEAGYLTNETVFSLTERPRRLAVIGGGPIGCELAQVSPLTPILFSSLIGFFLAPKSPLIKSQLKATPEAVGD